MITSAYIHIPFCLRKCHYCSFVSFDKLDLKTKYLNSLLEEIKTNYINEELSTLYLGGGTPSLLCVSEIDKVVKSFNLSPSAEVTMELNPETVNLEYLEGIKSIGINRLSFGVQVFDDEILASIGRGHCIVDVEQAILNAKKAGFENISIDLIYGLPNQSIESFVQSLEKAIMLEIQHLSFYGLKIEEGCFFYDNQPKKLPDIDDQAQMYLKAIEFLSDKGFEHYEISNFSKIGFESKHNLRYWSNEEYYGFGVAASGYESGVRYQNEDSIEKYIQNPLAKKNNDKVSNSEKLEEEIFLGFRCLNGIDVQKINQKFSIEFDNIYKKILDKYLQSGHILKTDKGYKLSIEGVLLSTDILSEFID